MNISVLLVLGMLFSSSQGGMGIPNCNFTNPIVHQQGPCCLEECDHTSEKTICEYGCPKDMFLCHNMLWDKNGGSLCPHGCRQTCPENYDGIRINDIKICVECFILCRLEIPHTSCKCQKEKIENEESSLETKDDFIIALAIISFLLFVGLVMVGCCYWKRKRNKDNTKTTENNEMGLQDISIKDDGNIQVTKIEIEPVDDTRYVEDPTKSLVQNVNTMKKCPSTQRIESHVYTEVNATEINTSSASNARPALTPSIDDGHECSSFTQERSYENTNNDHLERQPHEHVPDDNDAYEILNIIKTAINASGGESNRSRAIPSDNSENGNQGGKNNRSRAIPSDINENGNQGGKSNRSRAIPSDISENGNQGGKNNRSRAIPCDINENGNQGGKSNRSRAIPSDISENGNQGGKNNRSRAIPSDINENGNQGGKSNRSRAIPSDNSENGNQGGKNNRSRAIPSDINENGNQGSKSNRSRAIPSDISENGNQGDKSNRSRAIPSDISENGNQGGKGKRSRAIPSDISENSNQGDKHNRSTAIPSDISENDNQGGKRNRSRAIPSDNSENGNQGGKNNRSRAIPSDINENGNQGGKSNRSRAIPSDISENGNQGGKSKRSGAIPSDIGENGNQVGTDRDTDSSYNTAQEISVSSAETGAEAFLDDGCEMKRQPSYENMLIANNECLGNQTREHDPGEDDLYENSITMKIATNVSADKSNRSSAISSDSSENGNKVDTVSDTSSSYETARESSASSTESVTEARVTQNTANSKIKASGYPMNITANNVIFNIAN